MALLAVAQVVLTALAAWVVGCAIVGERWQLPHPGLRIAAGTGIGLLVLSHLLYSAVMLGYLLSRPLLGPTLLWSLFALIVVLAARAVSVMVRARGGTAPAGRRPHVWLLGGGAALYALWLMLWAYLPVTSLDEMVYHLEVPKRILEIGYLPVFTDNVLAYYPMGPQMLFLFGLGVGGEFAARLFHSLHALLLCLAIYGYARTFLDRTGASIAAVLFATVPTVMVIGAWAYIDMNFTLYGFLALVATIRYTEAREESERSGLRWAVFAGILAGGAWTVKYTGLQFVLLLFLVVLIAELRSRTGRLPFGLAALGGIAFAMFLPHMLRTWLITGWPLFPFAMGPFELTGAVNWSPEQSDLALAWQRQYGVGYDRNLYERLMSSVWVYTSAQANYTAYDGVVGPVFLLAPLAFLARRRPPQLALLGVFAAGFTMFWSLTTTQVRFLIPLLPVMAILVAVATTDRLRPLFLGAVAICVAISVFVAVEGIWSDPARDYWGGDISRDEFLTLRLGPYPIYMEANRRLGPGDRLYMINMRTWGYLLDLPGRGEMSPFPNGWRSDYTFEHFNLQRALTAALSPTDVEEFFDARGITHVMIDEGVTLGPDGLGTSERTKLIDYFRRHATLLYRNRRDPLQSLWRLRTVDLGQPQ